MQYGRLLYLRWKVEEDISIIQVLNGKHISLKVSVKTNDNIDTLRTELFVDSSSCASDKYYKTTHETFLW